MNCAAPEMEVAGGVAFGYLGCREEHAPFSLDCNWARISAAERSANRVGQLVFDPPGLMWLVSPVGRHLATWPDGGIDLRGRPWRPGAVPRQDVRAPSSSPGVHWFAKIPIMNLLIPTHLPAHTIVSATDSGRRFELRSSEGGAAFTVSYFGEIMAENGLIVGDEVPALVLARAVDTGQEVVLFDGGRHGYDAMFVDEYDSGEQDARHADRLFDLGGCTEFAVEVEVFDNIDWDEEEDDFRDDEGVLRLVTGEEISSERLRADGYDALGVTIITPDGTRVDIVTEELA